MSARPPNRSGRRRLDFLTASVCVPHERSGVGLARHAFADQLASRGVEGPVHDDAVLVMSELVTNAIKHAAPLPSGEIRVHWSIQDDCLHMEITDGGAVTRPHAGVADMSSLGGRGLDIVRTVSDEWGVTEKPDCVTVWAEVRRQRRAASPNGRASRPRSIRG